MELRILRERAAEQIDPDQKKITLVVSDIEGCLNLDEKTYDFVALEWIRTVNKLARPDNALPFITVSSGRQSAFVEAIIRILGGRMPALFENGCGLFFPGRRLVDECEWHPFLNDPSVLSQFSEVRLAVTDLCRETGARRVIGKEFLLSLHPFPPMSALELRELVDETLSRKSLLATVGDSASAVDISPQGINKGTGLEWLISTLDQGDHFTLPKTAGVGDSNGDLPFLKLVGFPAAPSNASLEVRALAAYWPVRADGQGVVDIIQQCININLRY